MISLRGRRGQFKVRLGALSRGDRCVRVGAAVLDGDCARTALLLVLLCIGMFDGFHVAWAWCVALLIGMK